MIITLDKTYPTSVIDDIVTNHLRISRGDGELYSSAMQSVRNAFDAASDYINSIIVPTLVTMEVDVEAARAEMPTAPVSEVMSVTSDRKAVGYRLVANDKRAYLTDLPSDVTHITVEAQVGYSDGELPGAIYQAIVIIATSFFEMGADAEMHPRAKALLHPYRNYPYGL